MSPTIYLLLRLISFPMEAKKPSLALNSASADGSAFNPGVLRLPGYSILATESEVIAALATTPAIARSHDSN